MNGRVCIIGMIILRFLQFIPFMDEVLRNIIVQPKDKLVAKCPVCGEEVTAQIRFPNNVSDLFNISNKHRKFGSK